MSEPRIDPERLAALLDGAVRGAERERLLAELAESEADRLVLGDAAELLRELELDGTLDGEPTEGPDEDAGGSEGASGLGASDPSGTRPTRRDVPPGTDGGAVVGTIGGGASPARVIPLPLPAARPSTFRRWAPLAAAAAVLAAVGLWYGGRPGGSGALGDPAAIVAMVEAPAPAGGDALGELPWSATRGAGDGLAPRARAARFGARAAELALAARAGDAARVRALAADAARLVSGATASGAAVEVYRAVETAAGGASADSLDALLRRGWAAGAAAVGAEDASLGAWLAAARVAASRGDAPFFRAEASRRAADALAARGELDETARGAAARVRAAAGEGPAGDWAALGGDVETVLVALGR
jgi:hypothetical protein